MVCRDTVYFHTGHDEARGREMFTMCDWLCFSSKDMKMWNAHGPIMRVTNQKRFLFKRRGVLGSHGD